MTVEPGHVEVVEEVNTVEITEELTTIEVVSEGPQGPQGIPGEKGDQSVVAAQSPITYNAQTETVGIDSDAFTGTLGTPDIFAFDTTPTNIADSMGELSWNAGEGTLDLAIENGSILQIGQELLIRISNRTGSILHTGTVVYAYGIHGDQIDDRPSFADGSIGGERFIGLVNSDIPIGGIGYATHFGKILDITANYPIGTILWASPTISGGLTATTPVAPQLKLPIAFVLRQHGNKVDLMIRMTNGSSLGSTDDNVQFTNPTTGDLIQLDSGVWRNVSTISPSKIAGTAVINNDSRLSDQRTPTDGSVTNSKVAANAAIDPSKIFGTAVVNNDSRLSDQRTPIDGSVTTNKIVNGAVTSSKIQDSPTLSGTTSVTNLTVGGNLTVNGTTTTINSTTVSIDDPIFTLGGDTSPSADDNKDRGIEFRYHNGIAAKLGFFGYDDSSGKFTFLTDASNTNEIFTGTKASIDAYFSGSDINSGTVGESYIDSSIARLASPTFSGTVILPSTTSIGTVSGTEIGYLDGVTSGLQGQLNNKVDTTDGRLSDQRTPLDNSVTYSKMASNSALVVSNEAPESPKIGTMWVDANDTVENIVFPLQTASISNGAITSPLLATSLSLSGVPTAPTAVQDTNTTQIATTEFVISQGYLKNSENPFVSQISSSSETYGILKKTAANVWEIDSDQRAVYVQASAPSVSGNYVWIQTGLGDDGSEMTFWIEDGS